MTTIGYATLDVIPSFRGFGRNLERGMSAPMLAASSKAGTQAGTTAAKGFSSKFESGIAGIGPKLLGALGVAAAGKEIIGLQASFESSINVLGESANLSAAQMQRMADFAKEMGSATVFSAGEAADAMVELAKAGLAPAAIEAGALKATMAVAATEGLALADSATIMSNAMTTFRIEGSRATEVADALAGGSKASTASVASLSEAMSQVGGSAYDAGLSLQETVAALAAFDQEGIKGSDAGTSLKTMLSRLVPQTDKASSAMESLGLSFTDASGEFLPLAEIAGQLQKALGGLSAAERTSALNTIFGADARRAALALMSQGEKGIQDFTAATSDMGAAQRLADARMSGTAGAIERMSGAIETAGLALGEAFAPAVVGSADAVAGLADVAGGAVSAFMDLPAPIKAATGAFVALRVASATGLTASAASGAASLGSAVETLRLRTMLAVEAFQTARTGVLEFSGNSGRAVAPVGRLSASMAGLKAGAQGAGSALKSGLSGGMALLGGPWGAAMIGGTAVVTAFWQEHERAKQQVDDFRGSLDQTTGSLTKMTAQMAITNLQNEGWLEYMRENKISMELVSDAILNGGAAMDEFREKTSDGGVVARTFGSDMAQFSSEVQNQRQRILDAQSAQKLWSSAVKDSESALDGATDATGEAASGLSSYRQRVEDAQIAVAQLLETENDRRLAAVQSKRDQLALTETLNAAAEEARKGKRTLDESTKAGRENWASLLDLADQWNNTTGDVQQARGAYADMRREFVDVAAQMGATGEKARQLADRFLKVPEVKDITIRTPGMEEALRNLKEAQSYTERLRDMRIALNVGTGRGMGGDSGPGYASGGYISGPGTGTSDSIFARLSNGEFVQRAAAVDYYGVDFMRRLNNLQLPKAPGYASGGLVQSNRATRGGGGVQITIGQVVAHDYGDFMGQMQRRATAVAGGGVSF